MARNRPPGSPAQSGMKGKVTALDPQITRAVNRAVQRGLKNAVPDFIASLRSSDWFGPQQPVPPQAPPEASDVRVFDYATGFNINYQPRKYEAYTAAQLRWSANNCPLVQEVIHRRIDEIQTAKWDIVDREGANVDDDPDVIAIKEFFRYPSGHLTEPFSVWQRKLLEEMYVIDAACCYPWPTANGDLYRLEIVDGATITPLIDESGRIPDPPQPAYQQIIKGMPYRNFQGQTVNDGVQERVFTASELIYFPRSPRSYDPRYGFSQVEQVLMTIALAIKSDLRSYYYFTEGTIPDALMSVPESWTGSQVAKFQAWFDAMMQGNLRRRSGGVIFVPGNMKEAAFKDYNFSIEMWEWYARMICAGWRVSPQPYVREQNRATAQTAQVMQVVEGLEPDKHWFKDLIDLIISRYFGRPDLCLAYQDEENIDPQERAKAYDIQMRGGQKTPDEIRVANGDDPYEGGIGKKPFIVVGNQVLLLEDIEGNSKASLAGQQNGAAAVGQSGGTNNHNANPAEAAAAKPQPPTQVKKKSDELTASNGYLAPQMRHGSWSSY